MRERDKFQPGDRVLAGIHWGRVVGPCPFDSTRIWVELDCIGVSLGVGEMRSYHWAECYAEADVEVVERKRSDQMTNMNRDDKVRAQSSPWFGGVEIAAIRRGAGGSVHFLSAEWRACADGNAPAESLLKLTMEQAQVLMDDLWHAGVRPTEGAGSAGAMRAAQEHISDLRKVAFKALGIEG